MATITRNSDESKKHEGEIEAQIAQLREDLAKLTTTIGEVARARGYELGEAARDEVSALGELGRESALRIKQRADALHDQAGSFVARNPDTSVGIAAGLGFIAGMIAARR